MSSIYLGSWDSDVPIYIWYDLYPPHVGAGYEDRVSRVSPNSSYGKASLNLTRIQESDQGWYECKVVFLNRPPSSHTKNGTWFFLDVHAPPRFSVTPEEVIYVNLGDAIILNCQAEGTPTPEIVWYRDDNIVEVSATTGVFNDGTELRISNIRSQDIGDYTCLARNGEGQISHSPAVIMVPPLNQTKLEGEKVNFPCEAKAMPGNVTVRWSKEGVPVKEVGSLETRVVIKKDGTLVINPVGSDDSGLYMCEVSNGIGEPQAAQAYLNVEFPAKVTFTPTVQYLPFRLQGVVQCHIKANPTFQYVTWTKDKRLLEPYQTKDIVVMQNGSLLFTRVNQNHQGRYTCTPYNAHGTQGSSGQMEVLVRKPPAFTIKPEAMYQRKVGESVDMHCEAQEAEGTQKPTITWQRRDGVALPKNRVKIVGGNITIEGLRRVDFGYYECVVSNEVATIVQAAQLVVEGTQPHAPYNITGVATEFSVTLEWLPGYSGGPDLKQNYVIWYREQGNKDWLPIPVTPPGSTQITINRLTPATTYEFQVVGKNELGDGMLSNIVVVKTKAAGSDKAESLQEKPTKKPDDEHKFIPSSDEDVSDYRFISFPTDSTGVTLIPPVFRPKGPKPGPPRNVSVTEVNNGFVISWQPPLERASLIQYYLIKYRTDGSWKTLNKGQIRPEENSYLVKSLVGGRTYHFRVLAYSVGSFESSEEAKFAVPARVKHKAITAGVVGGILFFIVAIILSVCFVKICNKRKRRRQEKAYNMVACRITDARNGGQIPGPCQVPLKKIQRLFETIPNESYTTVTWCFTEPWPVSPRASMVNCEHFSQILNTVCFFFTNKDSTDSMLRTAPPRDHRYDYRSGEGRVPGVGTSGSTGGWPGLSFISRTADGRFVVASSRASSVSSSSDDGGFLSRPYFRNRASWRRPLVRCPSDLSLQSMEDCPVSPALAAPQTPFKASSPTSTLQSPVYFSDLSSVPQISSAERTLRSVHEQYSQELPSLRAIHEENQRILSPRHSAHRLGKVGRLPPRHVKYARSAPELTETSPESRSSSSGFGSKNTSQQTGSTGEWRLPPYRPPPPPPPIIQYWAEFTPSPSHSVLSKPISVDDHYEFDTLFPSTPTPTELTPHSYSHSRPRTPLRMRSPKFDNIEARVQAMKEEFYAYKKRQAEQAARRQTQILESAC
ncbi:hypothetical protein M8J75_011009 [Diaphorina citri]|nr:hypothetical protein M8J75_011009 [Diaphorina citri]